MPIYVRFLQNGMPIRGAVRSGGHAGWTELQGFALRGHAAAASMTPSMGEIVISKATDSSGGGLQRSLDGWRIGGMSAAFDFTTARRAGGETSDLDFVVHDVRLRHYEPARRLGPVSVELAVLGYSRITPAGTTASAPDITAQVRMRLAAHQAHADKFELFDWPGRYPGPMG